MKPITWIVFLLGFIVIFLFFRYVYRKEIELEREFQKKFANQQIILIDKKLGLLLSNHEAYLKQVEWVTLC